MMNDMPLFSGHADSLRPEIKKQTVVRSYSFDQDELISNILGMHCSEGIDLDCTYSTGGFYSSGKIPVPRFKTDIMPQSPGVIKAAAQDLPFRSSAMNCVMFDPPFFWGNHGGQMAKRFGVFKDLPSLERVYHGAIEESHRVLSKGGILIFKCQDICTGSRNHFLHNTVLDFAESTGFEAVDLFLLLQKSRMNQDYKQQQHARKHHCYFWVFRKRIRRRRRVSTIR